MDYGYRYWDNDSCFVCVGIVSSQRPSILTCILKMMTIRKLQSIGALKVLMVHFKLVYRSPSALKIKLSCSHIKASILSINLYAVFKYFMIKTNAWCIVESSRSCSIIWHILNEVSIHHVYWRLSMFFMSQSQWHNLLILDRLTN